MDDREINEEELLQEQILNLETPIIDAPVEKKVLTKEETSLKGRANYTSSDIHKVIENLEFLTHRPTKEMKAQLEGESKLKEKRLAKMQSLVNIANNNLDIGSFLSVNNIVENPKLTSFKLMKLDME